jgi:hypothetical protein
MGNFFAEESPNQRPLNIEKTSTFQHAARPIQRFRSHKSAALHLPDDMACTFLIENNVRDHPVGNIRAKINGNTMRETLQ